MSGIEGVTHIKERLPGVQIAMLSVYGDDDNVFAAICAGAFGLPAATDDMLQFCAALARRADEKA